MQPGDTVIGSAELAFGMGFDAPLRDDDWFGRFTGLKADWLVIEHRYRGNAQSHPFHVLYNRRLLDTAYTCVYNRNHYEIHRRPRRVGPDSSIGRTLRCTGTG